MSLSKRITLTIKDYSMTLSGNLNFYVNDCLDLVFEINKWGIDNKKATVNDSKFDLTGITAYLFVENSNLVDSIEATKIEDNEITFKFTNKYTILVGKGRMQIKLVDEDGCELKLPPFNYNIESTINEFADMNPDNESVLVSEDGAVLLTEDGKLLMIPSEFNNPNLVKISDLPVVDSLKYTDDLLVNNNGVTKRVPVSDVKISTEQAEYISKIPEITSQLEQIKNLEGYEINNKAREKQGFITFITDDARIHDYTLFKDIFAEQKVPCCTAVIPDRIINNNPAYCTLEQLKELQNVYGWEILSHTFSHVNLKDITEEVAERELKDSKEWLNANGLKCESLAYPYGNYNDSSKKIARKYYRSARTTITSPPPTSVDKITPTINYSPIPTYELTGVWLPNKADEVIDAESGFSIQSLDYFKYYIDKAYATNGWLIISCHSWEVDERRIGDFLKQIIVYAKSKGDIVTVSQGLDRIGNIIDIGERDIFDNTKPHFSIGVEGDIHTNLLMEKNVGYDKFKPSNVLNDFEDNIVTTTLITTNYAVSNSFPSLKAGIFKTYKYTKNIYNLDFNRQEYITFDGVVYLRRYNISNSNWTSWTNTGSVGSSSYTILTHNSVTSTTEISTFPTGVSEVTIQSNNSTGFPELGGGILITHTFNKTNGSMGYNYQEYHPYNSNNIYKRSCNNDGTYKEWFKIADIGFRVLKADSVNNSTPISDFPIGVTETSVATVNASGFPENSGGVLITHVFFKMNGNMGYNYQEYHLHSSHKIYKRCCNGDGTYKEWESVTSIAGATEKRPTANLYNGKTYFDITIGKPIWYFNNSWRDSNGTIV